MEEAPNKELKKEDLRRRWVSLFNEFDPSLASDFFDELYNQYDDPKRLYHNIAHVDKLLRLLDECDFVPREQKRLIEIAIWFHDVIYSPEMGGDDELESANFAEEKLTLFGLSVDMIQDIKGLILITKHKVLPETDVEKIMVDLDLSILGSKHEEYDEYSISIREEYGFVPESDYRIGRSNVLRNFLDRAYIFSTEFFRTRFELRAKENIQREMDSLTV